MRLKDVIEVIDKEYTVIVETYNKYGYETTYALDLNRDGNILNPKYKNARVTRIEALAKGKIGITIFVSEE